jgi:hypothetical protein
LSVPTVTDHKRINIPRPGIGFVDLCGEPQPTVSEVKLCDLAFGVSDGVGCPEALIGADAESVARHHESGPANIKVPGCI